MFSLTLTLSQITRIESVHNKSLIYRDIKPDNFLIGPPGTKHANTVYLIGTQYLLHSDFFNADYSRVAMHSVPIRHVVSIRLRNGETLPGSKDEAAHSLPRAEELEWNCSIHEYQHTFGARYVELLFIFEFILMRTLRTIATRRHGISRPCVHVFLTRRVAVARTEGSYK